MVRFSLVPGKSLDIVGIPDIDFISKFASGDLGISKSMMETSFKKYSKGLSGETLDIFTKLSEKGEETGSGLPAMEKVIVKSMLETQKPYIEVALSVLQSLVVIEDVIAVSLAGVESESLKPKTNDESLYTKVNKLTDKLTNIQTEIQPNSNSYKNISISDKQKGISMEQLGKAYNGKSIEISDDNLNEYEWEIVSTEYSTGAFIESVPYVYKYRNITEFNTKKTSKFTPNESIVPDNKPVIIFDIYVSYTGDPLDIRRITDLSELPEEWNISDKWEGEWDHYSTDKTKFNSQYLKYVKESLSDGMIKNGVTDPDQRNEVTDIVVNSLPIDSNEIDFHKEMMNSSLIKENSGIGQYLLRSNEFGYVPKKINGEWVDPETDYHLQVIKVIPSTSDSDPEDINTDFEKLSVNTPLTHNYNGYDIKDVLFTEDYTNEDEYYTLDDYRTLGVHTKMRKKDIDDTDEYGYTTKDKKVYYIVEGIYRDRKEVDKKSSPQNGEEFYKFGPPLVRFGISLSKMISKFIKFGVTFLPKLLEEIQKAIKLFNNPFNFIFEIVMENVSNSFTAFSPETLEKFTQLSRIKELEAKKEFIKSEPSLKNVVAFDDQGNYRYIFDGAGVTSLFGHNFGIGIKSMSPKLIMEKNGTDPLGCNEIPPDRGNNDNNNNNDGDNNNNRLVGSSYEIVNTEYSTGDYIEGVNYKYYYITMDNEALVNKANSLLEQSNSLGVDKANSISLKLDAMEHYQKALVKDPSNIYLNNQLNELQKEEGVQTNIMLQFIIDMIALPIKLVLCIIDYILNFFKTLKILEIPKSVPVFFTFKWILEILKPSKILELLGIKLDPSKILEFSTESINPPSLDILKTLKFDTSQIISAPFLGKLPIYNALQFPSIIEGGSKITLTMESILKFLESLINEMICFLLNVFNIDKLFPCPKMNLTKLGEGSFDQSELEGDNDNGFVYDIKLSSGEIISGLSKTELDQFISSNSNLEYKYI